MNNDTMLRIISNEVKDSIDQFDVVTPSMYASIFSKLAIEHEIDIEDEKTLSKDILLQECNNLTYLQNQATKNALSLSQNATKAINAIKEKDEKILNDVLRETEALRREIGKLKESVYKDELTNVHNRKWLHDQYLHSATGSFKEAGTLVIIDLNYFKIVNDTFGHIVGDKVLIFLANYLRKTKHSVIRYGGDEFILIIKEDISTEEIDNQLNSLREDILNKKLKAQQTSFKISYSFGMHQFKENEILSDVIEIADKDMYKDKIQIKKRVTGI